jgi:hypothetical protein
MPSTPALLDITVSPLTALRWMASISENGTPHNPNPPHMIVISSVSKS